MYSIFNDNIETSGNNTTLNRIGNLLNLDICNKIQNNIIGIHAFKFGLKLINKNINYITIIGGTDINIDINNNKRKEIIISTILNSKYVVCFSNYIKNEVKKLININDNKIRVIAQSISYIEPEKFDIKEYIFIKFGIRSFNKIYLVVGNIRKVKDPSYLDKIADYFHNNNILILFIGKIIEEGIKINNLFFLEEDLNQKQIFACYKQSDGLINISESEGMASAILEAMIYRCPVYVRANKGNLSIVKNGYNGYVFNNIDELLSLMLLETENIVINAYNYVLKNHNCETEKEEYLKMINS